MRANAVYPWGVHGLELNAGWGKELEAGGPLGDDEEFGSAKILEHPVEGFSRWRRGRGNFRWCRSSP